MGQRPKIAPILDVTGQFHQSQNNMRIYSRRRKLKKEQTNLTIMETFFCKSNKKAQLSLTNPRDACEKYARFT